VRAARSGWLVRCAGAALTTGVAVLLATTAARADGDPASDYLLVQPVFFPFRPAPKPLEQELSAFVKSANDQGLQVRVAIIQSPHDLGSIPELFGRPDVYARFLSAEISSAWTHRVLVVMPNGYGIAAGAHIQNGGSTGHVSRRRDRGFAAACGVVGECRNSDTNGPIARPKSDEHDRPCRGQCPPEMRALPHATATASPPVAEFPEPKHSSWRVWIPFTLTSTVFGLRTLILTVRRVRPSPTSSMPA
jgi:hypothetical protein